MKRAMTAEAKAARAQQIMDVAAEMLMTTDYRLLKMSNIAKAAGISNGLIFTYFKTKETLFLCLLWREYEKRLDYLEAETEKTPMKDFSDIQDLLLAELERLLYHNPVYIKLESMRSVILEKNADTKLLLNMKEELYGRVGTWSKKLSETGIISQREILDIFFAEIGVIIGCYLQNAILADVREVISARSEDRPCSEDGPRSEDETRCKEITRFGETDFRESILRRMRFYLEGYKQNLDN